MSCDRNRSRFFQHSTISGTGSLAAQVFGSPAAATSALEQIFNVKKNRPFDETTHQGRAAQLLARQKTKLLLKQMEELGLKPPAHSEDGLPKLDAQRGYAEVFDTLRALNDRNLLPLLGNEVLQAQQQRQQINANLPAALAMAERLRTSTGEVDQRVLNALLRRLPEINHLPDFAQQALGMDHSPELKAVGGGNGKGVSGAPVYILRDRSGNPKGILKVFPKSSQLGEELSALSWLEQGGFQSFQAPRILNAGTRMTGNVQEGVLVTTYAPGLPLDDLVQRAAARTEEEQSFMKLDQAVQDTAAGLAELHRTASINRAPSPMSLNRHLNAVQEIADKLASSPVALSALGSNADELRQRISRIMQGFENKVPSEAVVTHGDAHPGNFFHSATDGVTFIDTPTLHRALDADGNATDVAARDVEEL